MSSFRLIPFIILCLACTYATCAEPKTVYFAGVSFAGDSNTVEKRFPYSQTVINNESQASEYLRASLRSQAPQSFKLYINDATNLKEANLDPANSTVMTIAIDGELVSAEKMGDYHEVFISITGQLIFFDFNKKTIIACYPVGIELLTICNSETPPGAQFYKEKIRSMFLAPDSSTNINFFDLCAHRLSKVSLNLKAETRVQIRSVDISPEALPVVMQTLKDPNNGSQTKLYLANQFSKHLSANLNIPLLPYLSSRSAEPNTISEAGASYSQLMLKVSDGTVYNLKLPKPDYVFDITLEKLKKVKIKQGVGNSKWVYGSVINLKFIEPIQSKTIYNQVIKNPWFEDIPDGENYVVSDMKPFIKSLGQLTSRVAAQLATSEKSEWAEAQPTAKTLFRESKDVKSKLTF